MRENKTYTHLTPVYSLSERKSGLDGYILSNSVANLSYRSIFQISYNERSCMNDKIINSIYSKEGELRFLHLQINGSKTSFFVPADFLLQVGHLVFPKDNLTKRHRHAVVPRKILYTAEVLIIISGKLEYTISDYKQSEKILIKGIANPHEILILGKVGHSFKSIVKSEIIEVKQGPYLGCLDKEYD